MVGKMQLTGNSVHQVRKNGKQLKAGFLEEDPENNDMLAGVSEVSPESEKSDQLQIPDNYGLLINIHSHGSLALSSFVMLSEPFQQYYRHCCSEFRILPTENSMKTPEHRAAVTYSILKLLFDLGYNSQEIAVSGLDTLILLAACDAMKLPDTCFVWKQIKTLMKQAGKNKAERMQAILAKMDINFQTARILVSMRGSKIQNPESVVQAILSDEIDERRFLNTRMEHYMVCGSTNHFYPGTKIQTPQDFLDFFLSRKDHKTFKTWQNMLLQKNTRIGKNSGNFPGTFYLGSNPSSPSKHGSVATSLQINLKQEYHMFDHLVQSRNVLSAATLLTKIHEAIQNQKILENVTFLSPVTFTSEDNFLEFEIRASKKTCFLIHNDRRCVSFQYTNFSSMPKISSEISHQPEDPKSNDTFNFEDNTPEEHESSKPKKHVIYRNSGTVGKLEQGTVIEEDEFYSVMKECHYEYRGEFHCVRRLEIRSDHAIVYLKQIEHLDVLIDGTMQSMVFTYLRQHGTNRAKLATLVPFHMQNFMIIDTEMELTQKTRNSSMVARAIFEIQWQNDQLTGSFELETGKAVIAAKEVSFRPAKHVSFTGSYPEKAAVQEIPNKEMKIGQKRLLGDIEEGVNRTKEENNILQKAVTTKSVARNRNPSSSTERENGLHQQCEQKYRTKQDTSRIKNPENSQSNLEGVRINDMAGYQKEIYLKSFACRLPRNIHDPAGLWDALKTGQLMAEKIPCSRIETRDRLADGRHYGHPIKCANLLCEDVAQFDAQFFGISKSEAEKMDPQQRLLLECVQECMENAGLKSLENTGFFIGLMANEYPDLARKHADVVSMLGSSASIASGRLSYVFRSTGPAVTLDTACSSSLVALQTAVAALRSGQCKTAIVGGVNLILTEESIGQRANGHLLSEDGRCRSFDGRVSGYGRADGCVVFALSIDDGDEVSDNLPPYDQRSSTVDFAEKSPAECSGQISKRCGNSGDRHAITVAANVTGHNGRSASLTAPCGTSQARLLQHCLRQILPSEQGKVDYWEAHGTGTLLGDAIELKALQSRLKHPCVVSTAKTHFGHSEAAAGVVGLAKLFLQFAHNYIPEHGCYEFSENFKNSQIYLPIVGQEWDGQLAGLSSFGISGTNAMVLLCRSINKTPRSDSSGPADQANLHIWICPVSAASTNSLQLLVKSYRAMLNESSHETGAICSAAALQRNHLPHRAVFVIRRGEMLRNVLFQDDNTTEEFQCSERIGLEISSSHCLFAIYRLCTIFPEYKTKFCTYFRLMKGFLKQQQNRDHRVFQKLCGIQDVITVTGIAALVSFVQDIGIELNGLHVHDNRALTSALLLTGKLTITAENTADIFWIAPKMRIFTDMSRSRAKNYKWYSLLTIDNQKIAEFDQKWMNFIAQSYLHGSNIVWKRIYSSAYQNIVLPNYQFDRKPYWIIQRPVITEHRLLGRLIKIRKNEVLFENQLSQITNPELFVFQYGRQIRMTFGICCEAILEAVRLTQALRRKKTYKSGDCEQRGLILKHLKLVKHCLKDGAWFRTSVSNMKDNQKDYFVRMTSGTKVICDARVQVNEKMNINKFEGLAKNQKQNFRICPDFYEKLNSNGLLYKGIYQVISSLSPATKTFVAKSSITDLYVAIEILVQVACYYDLISPDEIYGSSKFRVMNLKYYRNLSRTVFVKTARTQITLYNEGLELIAVTFKKQDKMTKLANSRIKSRESDSRSTQHSPPYHTEDNTYQECIEKVKRAVADIRNSGLSCDSEQQLSVSFIELGLDSLAITDLANRLQTVYFPGLQINTVDLFNFSSISSLAEAIYSQKIAVDSGARKQVGKIVDQRSLSETPGKNKKQHLMKVIIQDTEDNHKEVIKNLAWKQLSVERKFENPEKAVIITDVERIPNKNELLLIASTGNSKKSESESKSGIMYLNGKNPEITEEMILAKINKWKLITATFELSSNFPLPYLIEILLLLARVVNKVKCKFEFRPKPGNGRANAFALGFTRSLVAELYPKTQYKWDFCLEKMILPELTFTSPTASKQLSPTEERWLVTGGLGGIGWQMAQWIVKNRTVSHLFLLGRRQPDAIKCREIKKMRREGINVQAVSVDLTSGEQVRRFFRSLQVSLTGIIHSAGNIHDALALQQTTSTFHEAVAAKCDGLLHLAQMCSTHPLEHFIVNSSISAIIGNRGQCNYSAASAYVDEFMLERNAQGFPATTINWGNWLETGMAANINANLHKMGFTGLKTKTAMAYLQYAIEYKPVRLVVAATDVRKILRYRPDLLPVFEGVIGKNSLPGVSNRAFQEEEGKCSEKHNLNDKQGNVISENSSGARMSSEFSIQEMSRKKIKEKCPEKFRKYQTNNNDIHRIISTVVQILEELTDEQVTAVNFTKSFMELGLDSFKMYRFVSALSQRIKSALPLNILTVFENPTIEQLSRYIAAAPHEICANPGTEDRKASDLNETKSNVVLQKSREKNHPGIKSGIFHFLVLREENLEKLNMLRSAYSSQLEKSSKSLKHLEKQWLNAINAKTGILQIAWGSRRKNLKQALMHPETVSNCAMMKENLGENPKQPKLCLMFTGHGSQTWNMGRQLAEIFPVFRQIYDEMLLLADKFMPPESVSLRDVLRRWSYRSLLYKTEYAQPVIFCFEYSLAKLYEACGVQGDFFVGHSVGEIVAYTVAGRITCNEALKLVVQRAQILAQVDGKGKMFAVKRGDAPKLQHHSGMSRAAENSHMQIILSGDNQAASRCLRFARKRGYTVTVIDHRYPFHSAAISSALEQKYTSVCKQVQFHKSNTGKVVSNRTGKFLDDEHLETSWKLLAPINSPVLFKKCIETLRDHGTEVWLEIGSGEVLSAMVRGILNQNVQVSSAIAPGKQEVDSFIGSLATLHRFHVRVSWEKIYKCAKPLRKMSLPQSPVEKRENLHFPERRYLEKLAKQHQINGLVTVPAAVFVAIFVQFINANSKTNGLKPGNLRESGISS
ncbi:unnamed protein product, partial [Gongylonema pulchrum]|uniref:Fatty acid synthase n=1 Tax=Gongylonema pulchrum TaxID=637853 RepID=A0A183CVK6_9BILA